MLRPQRQKPLFVAYRSSRSRWKWAVIPRNEIAQIMVVDLTMPLLTIHHKAEYRHCRPDAFGAHNIMRGPHDGHDRRVFNGAR
ncbi:hypothetical protein [Bradyrhizobium sp. STM 3562]|uniref:hypothetical protein n=1 Tax=Bradyrhizobium sp. STM 3562 TaxID=578924 RepID=UPI00388F5F40